MPAALPPAACCVSYVLQVATADLRQPETLPAVVSGVDAVCCCTGTTAFPSNRCGAFPMPISSRDAAGGGEKVLYCRAACCSTGISAIVLSLYDIVPNVCEVYMC
jgi:hypothetical protein